MPPLKIRLNRPGWRARPYNRRVGLILGGLPQGRPRSLDQLQFQGLENGAGTVAHAELAQHMRNVVFHRALGEVERVCDLAVAIATCKELQDLDLALGQRVRVRKAIEIELRQLAPAAEVLGERRQNQISAGRKSADGVRKAGQGDILEQEPLGPYP